MKSLLLSFAVAAVLFTGCKTDMVKPAAAATQPAATSGAAVTTSVLVAKWHLVKDSTSAQLIGPAISNVYVGTPDDYYDFRGDGKCYIRENGVFDTLNYKLATDTSVTFNNGFPSPVDPLTNHTARIDVFQPQDPGGPNTKTVYLSK